MRASFRIVLIYAIAASCWIVLSDKAVGLIASDMNAMTWFATVKGLAFVAVTSLLLFLLIKKELSVKNNMIERLKENIKHREELVSELHHRIKNNLQVVKSLVHLETAEAATKEELAETIMDEIQAISAVFEIVYEKRIMTKLPLDEAIERFLVFKRSRNSGTAIKADIRKGLEFKLEMTTSIILLLNVLIDVLNRNNNDRSMIEITIPDPRTLRLTCKGIECQTCLDLISGSQLVEAYLKMLEGRMLKSDESIEIKIQHPAD